LGSHFTQRLAVSTLNLSESISSGFTTALSGFLNRLNSLTGERCSSEFFKKSGEKESRFAMRSASSQPVALGAPTQSLGEDAHAEDEDEEA
jgi:hypothetical protein